MPFVICSTGDALAFKVAVANRTSATCDGARGRARGRPEDRDSIFSGFERSRRATRSLTNSPTLSRIATIGFILVTHRLRRPAMDETGAELIVSGTAPSAQRSGFAWCEKPVC